MMGRRLGIPGILDFNQVWTKFSDKLIQALNKLILVNASRRARIVMRTFRQDDIKTLIRSY